MTHVIDARNMMPPEPFEKTMDALCTLPSGEHVLLILNREPFPLYRVLEQNGYLYRVTPFEDGRFEIDIWQAPR